MANLENDAKWRREFVETRKTSEGPIGIGTRFSMFGEFLGRRMETVWEVTEYEPNRIAAWKTLSGPLQMKFWRTFERVESGTRFAFRYEGEARGFLRLAWPLIIRMARRQHEDAMGELKELMEARAL